MEFFNSLRSSTLLNIKHSLFIIVSILFLNVAFTNDINKLIEELQKKYLFIGGGSGVVISSDGYALTNAHVVGAARKFIVRFVGGKTAFADLINIDPLADVALIKIKNMKDMPYAKLGNSHRVKVGNVVIAIGNPYILGIEDFTPTVTKGIITAKHIYISDILQARQVRFAHIDTLQTDASINPGNSGGPLFNLKGELIGINSSLRSRWAFEGISENYRFNTGTGYAIPINYIKKLLPKLYAQEFITHCFLYGLQFENPGYRSALFFEKGLIIAKQTQLNLLPEGFNVVAGDTILKVNNKITNNMRSFYHYIIENVSTDKLTVTVKKKDTDKIKNYTFKCQEYPRTVNLDSKTFYIDMNEAFLGVELEDVEQLVGVKISRIMDNSPAKAVLKENDVIVELEGKQILSSLDFNRNFQFLKPGYTAKIKVKRGDEILQVEIKLGKKNSY